MMDGASPNALNPAIAATRTAHLLHFLKVLTDEGVVASPHRLRQLGLPLQLGDDLEAPLPLLPCIDLVDGLRREHGIAELGWRACRGFALHDLSPLLVARVQSAATLREALETFCRFVCYEDNLVTAWIEPHLRPGRLRACSMLPLDWAPEGLRLSEWVQVMAVVAIVRAFAGPDWAPEEIGFRHACAVEHVALACLPATSFCLGQSETWVSVPMGLLDYNRRGYLFSAVADIKLQQAVERVQLLGSDFAGSLKELLKSYLSSGYPDLWLAARVTGVSPRTLQRKLAEQGKNYSDVVAAARLELAQAMLADPCQKIIEIALAVGYDDPSHFTRAFRRTCGLTPREYRAHLLGRRADPVAADVTAGAAA